LIIINPFILIRLIIKSSLVQRKIHLANNFWGVFKWRNSFTLFSSLQHWFISLKWNIHLSFHLILEWIRNGKMIWELYFFGTFFVDCFRILQFSGIIFCIINRKIYCHHWCQGISIKLSLSSWFILYLLHE